ncbi:uncharacterized mitochondrial protein AtMg00810-like [Miscanthus floridulus]|uniref:uncharacterized mitochondrial protein AtMg00810-like n=1 Tax=Miscanthus floridulus TaxID=154761 RepID=UPI00345B1DE2
MAISRNVSIVNSLQVSATQNACKRSDSSLFVLRTSLSTAYILLYVDDMILKVSTSNLLQHIIVKLKAEFTVKDMGPVSYFLGINVQRTSDGFFLSQAQYVEDLIERAAMQNCKSVTTPAETKQKTSTTAGNLLTDPTFYRSMAGALQYLTVTRPDIVYAVQQLCLHMHSPRDVHSALLKRVLRYLHLRGTPALGVHLHRMSSPTITA